VCVVAGDIAGIGLALSAAPTVEWLAAQEAELAAARPARLEGKEGALIDALCTRQVGRCLERCGGEGVRGRALPPPRLRQRPRLVPRYARFSQSLLNRLAAEGVAPLERDETQFLADAPEVGPPVELGVRTAARSPRLAAFVDLLDHCVRHLPQVLAGEV